MDPIKKSPKYINFSTAMKGEVWANIETEECFNLIYKNWDAFWKTIAFNDFHNIYSAANCYKRFYIDELNKEMGPIDFKQISFQFMQWRTGTKTTLNAHIFE